MIEDMREYKRLLRQLHELIATGRGEAEEAEEIRDRMDGRWQRLTAAQRRRAGELSRDLYRQYEG